MEQNFRLRILEKRWETPDAATFTLEPVDATRALTYRSGQFLSLIFKVNGREKRRAYSFSSSPATEGTPAVTVKRVINGEFSNHLLDHAQPGDLLESAGVAGQFLLPRPLPRHLVYIAAGSGITPVFSQLKTLLAQPEGPRILLIYANRDSRNTMFKEQIDRWLTEFPERLSCRYFFSREKNAANATFGHLNNANLEELIRDYFEGHLSSRDRRSTVFFLCAPNAIMRMARMTLRLLDFPEKRIRQEVFQAPANLPVRMPDPSRQHQISVIRLGKRIEFQTYENETILNAALRQGIDLPYTCKAGVCLSCLAECVRGKVEVVFTELTRREGPGSMVNTCIGYAVSEAVELTFDHLKNTTATLK